MNAGNTKQIDLVDEEEESDGSNSARGQNTQRDLLQRYKFQNFEANDQFENESL